MKVIDILKTKHTVLMSIDGWHNYHQGLEDYTQKDLSLNDIIFHLGKKFENRINELRSKEYHSEEYNNIKEHCLPVWFVCGTFPFMKTEDNDINTYSNILCIDIDNQDIDRKAIFDLPYVIGVLKSAGGVGYYVLILVEDGKYTKEYYSYLSKMINKKYNIYVDEQCKNIGRKRLLSYEENIWEWIKPIDYDVASWKIKEIIENATPKQENRMIDYKAPKFSNNDINGLCEKAIRKLVEDGYSIDDMNVKENYNAWYYIACEFKHFASGEDLFIKFSQNSSKYSDSYKDIAKKWNNADSLKVSADGTYKKWLGICKNKYGKEWWRDQYLNFK